jgi:hypothetical protein
MRGHVGIAEDHAPPRVVDRAGGGSSSGTGLELPGWLGTILVALGALFGVIGLYTAYRETRQQR